MGNIGFMGRIKNITITLASCHMFLLKRKINVLILINWIIDHGVALKFVSMKDILNKYALNFLK